MSSLDEEETIRPLGKRELGRHAFEKQMPPRLAQLIETESPANKATGVVTTLAALLNRSRETQLALLCHEGVVQISKLRDEGNHFCGYRNMQMLLSTPLLPSPSPSYQLVYSIPQLQGMIELAWDQGFNAHGRVETQGIKGTRKHIGTSEVEALFESLRVPCRAAKFGGDQAWHDLLDAIEAYFISGAAAASPSSPSSSSSSMKARPSTGVHITKRAPVFLQIPAHSLTIVGIERTKNGRRQLLVFDPAYQPASSSSLLRKLSPSSAAYARLALFWYRRKERYLKRYRGFEILTLLNDE